MMAVLWNNMLRNSISNSYDTFQQNLIPPNILMPTGHIYSSIIYLLYIYIYIYIYFIFFFFSTFFIILFNATCAHIVIVPFIFSLQCLLEDRGRRSWDGWPSRWCWCPPLCLLHYQSCLSAAPRNKPSPFRVSEGFLCTLGSCSILFIFIFIYIII